MPAKQNWREFDRATTPCLVRSSARRTAIRHPDDAFRDLNARQLVGELLDAMWAANGWDDSQANRIDRVVGGFTVPDAWARNNTRSGVMLSNVKPLVGAYASSVVAVCPGGLQSIADAASALISGATLGAPDQLGAILALGYESRTGGAGFWPPEVMARWRAAMFARDWPQLRAIADEYFAGVPNPKNPEREFGQPWSPGMNEVDQQYPQAQTAQRRGELYGFSRAQVDARTLVHADRCDTDLARRIFEAMIVEVAGARIDQGLERDLTRERIEEAKPFVRVSDGCEGLVTGRNCTNDGDAAAAIVVCLPDRIDDFEQGAPVRHYVRGYATWANQGGMEDTLMGPAATTLKTHAAFEIDPERDVAGNHVHIPFEVMSEAYDVACRDGFAGLEGGVEFDPEHENPLGTATRMKHPFAMTGIRQAGEAMHYAEHRLAQDGAPDALLSHVVMCGATGVGAGLTIVSEKVVS